MKYLLIISFLIQGCFFVPAGVPLPEYGNLDCNEFPNIYDFYGLPRPEENTAILNTRGMTRETINEYKPQRCTNHKKED